MTRVLGVDGGQSGIRLRHSSAERVVNVPGVSRLEGDEVVAVADAVAQVWRGGAFEPADRVVLGLTTAPARTDDADRLCGLVGMATGAPEVWLTDDAVTAHAGALSLGWGVSLVAGTGVACLARSEDGATRSIGGHGFLLGDEGGAFWIGRRGIGAVLRAREGRGPMTTLTDAATARFDDLAELHIRLHELRRPVDAIAQFAPDVATHAADGDPVADKILADAALELVALARAGVALAGNGIRPVPLALGGRLLGPDQELRIRIDGLLADQRATIGPRTADASPLEGAIAIGLSGDPTVYGGLIHTWHAGAAR